VLRRPTHQVNTFLLRPVPRMAEHQILINVHRRAFRTQETRDSVRPR
jgi:hypothetical protein